MVNNGLLISYEINNVSKHRVVRKFTLGSRKHACNYESDMDLRGRTFSRRRRRERIETKVDRYILLAWMDLSPVTAHQYTP